MIYEKELNQRVFSNQLFYKIKNEKTNSINYNSLTVSDLKHQNEFLYLQNKSTLNLFEFRPFNWKKTWKKRRNQRKIFSLS